MHIRYKVNYLTNLYAHIENLACYHRFSSKSYPSYFGARILETYKKFRLKRMEDKEYEDVFSLAELELVRQKLRKLLTHKEYEVVKTCLNEFHPHFHELWIEKSAYLEKIRAKLENKAGEKLEILGKIFRVPEIELFVYLCWNPVETKATPFGGSGILLELKPGSLDPFPIILHEIVHILDVKTGNSLEFFRKKCGYKKALLITEAIANLFAPNGILIRSKFYGSSRWHKQVDEIQNAIKPAFLNCLSEGGDLYKDFIYKIPCSRSGDD